MARLYIFVTLIVLLQTGCAQYTRDMLWENKIKPTPYESPENTVIPSRWNNGETTYAWLGHATVLINFYGTMIVTDPVLLDRIGPPEIFDNLFGIKRITQLPLDAEDFPKTDIVLISHAHFDHLDLASLRALNEKSDYLLIVPLLTADLVNETTVNTIELDWKPGATKETSSGDIVIEAFRVEHYSYVDWGERDSKRGFNGYLLTSKAQQKKIAFFGDTSYSRYRDDVGEILKKPLTINWKEKFDAAQIRAGIDLCIIPIGESKYYWNHISPENAVRLAKELNCKKMLPIHYSTFILTPPDEEEVEPETRLRRLLIDENNLELVKCRSLTTQTATLYPNIGVTCVLPE